MPTLTRAANCRHSPGRHWVAICFRYVPQVAFRRTAHRRSPPVPFHKSFRVTLLCKIFVGPAQPTCPILRQYFAAKSKSGKPGSSFSPSTCKYELAQPCHEAGVIAFVLTKYFSWDLLGYLRLGGPCRSHLRQAIILSGLGSVLSVVTNHERTDVQRVDRAFEAESEANCR
jgi:hypothetical protein